MSQFLDDARALIDKISTGDNNDAETKAAVADLKAKLEENGALDADQSTVINELLAKLAASEDTTEGGGA